MNVLIIDDEPEVRKMVCKMLDDEDFEVHAANDGREGMRILRSGRKFDLVISDIVMPRKEGLEVMMEIKRDFPDIKVLAISGGGKVNAQSYLSLATFFGAKTTLKKPFFKSDLLSAIRKSIESD